VGKTLYQKVWDDHVVRQMDSGQYQLFIGLHLIHEVTSPQAFGMLKDKGLICDQTIEFTGTQTAKKCPAQLRRIAYRDAETSKRYVFLTNNFKLAAKTIADIYKARWQVELFFKWIKQNLKIKSFVGTSKNAVMTQIWIALCIYLLLAFLKYQSRLQRSTQQILRLLQMNLFEKRDLMALLGGDPPRDKQPDTNQMVLL